MRGFHNVTIKPTITASLQHTAAFSADDVLFNWTKFNVPRKCGRLIGVVALVRGTNGARQEQAFDLYFSKSDDFSLGTINSAVSFQPNNDLIGAVAVPATAYNDGLNTMEVATVSGSLQISMNPVPDPDTTTLDSGRKKYPHNESYAMYIGGVAQGGLDWRSTVKTTGAHSAGASNDITVDTTSALLNFAKGDVLHAQDDAVVGTVGSIPDATSVILATNTTNTAALANNDDLYNINPITITLTFAYEH